MAAMGNLDTALALLRAHFDLLVLGGLLFGLVLLAWLLVNVSGIRRRLRTELGDQRGLLREVREDIGDDVAQSRQQVQESLSAGLMRLQDLLDQRMVGLQRQMLQDSAALKTELIERFETQRKAIAENLADRSEEHTSELQSQNTT